jgi:ferrochelatase
VKDKETIGVILLNLGGPDSIQAVRPFLYNLFSDRKLIKLGPSFLQKTLAWLISSLRAKKTESMYSLIGGRSPILDITSAQAKALQEALCPMPHAFKVYVGMRYWHPLIEDVIPVMYRDGIRKSVALSLYPQYSVTTAGSSLTKLKDVVESYPIETFCIASWFDHPLYIEALADIIKKGLESFSQKSPPLSSPLAKVGQGRGINSEFRTPDSEPDIHVLFSAHSLPHKIVEKGDPYERQINGTIRELTKIIPIKWHLSFQSKSGPVKWLEPSTDEKLKELAAEGIKNILVVPISFVSDHIETLYEIDILYKNLAEKLGITLKRVDSLNTNPIFIEALKDLVIKSAKEKGWT